MEHFKGMVIKCFVIYHAFQYHNAERAINTLLLNLGGDYFSWLYSIPAVNVCTKTTGGIEQIIIDIFLYGLIKLSKIFGGPEGNPLWIIQKLWSFSYCIFSFFQLIFVNSSGLSLKNIPSRRICLKIIDFFLPGIDKCGLFSGQVSTWVWVIFVYSKFNENANAIANFNSLAWKGKHDLH